MTVSVVYEGRVREGGLTWRYESVWELHSQWWSYCCRKEENVSSPHSQSADPPLQRTASNERNHWSAHLSDPPAASEDSASALSPRKHINVFGNSFYLFEWRRCLWILHGQTHLSDVLSISRQSVGLVVQLLFHVLNLLLASVIFLHHLRVKTTSTRPLH